MTRREAQEILLSCRPGRERADDPQVAAALELARTDPELREWYEQHRAWDAAVRKGLNSIPVPPDLRWEILAGPKVIKGPAHWWNRRAIVIAAAAAIAFLITLAVVLLKPDRTPNTFAEFRTDVIGTVLRNYGMQLETNDMEQIRAFLDSRGAPADYAVPRGLQQLRIAGCGVLNSQGKTVSMLCFEDTDNRQVWMFFAKAATWQDRPTGEPRVERVISCATASWLEGDSLYVIASETSESSLRKLL